jgi:C4-dicarboxylate-specific signal transduction histidine kinase
MVMIEATHHRSEEALAATRAAHDNLERLVSEHTRDLEAATARANEAARAKGDFLANMSHEIRTPLNGIIASADLLRLRGDLPADSAEHARLIGESGELLLRLLGDILDFSKIEAGQLVLEPRPFTLAPVVHDTVQLLASQARDHGVTLTTSLAPDLPPTFVADSFRLRQILLNLLSNAIKFTPAAGHVTLTVALAPAPPRPPDRPAGRPRPHEVPKWAGAWPDAAQAANHRSQQRHAFRHAHHHRAGDLVMPRLALPIEGDPEETQTQRGQRQEAAQHPHQRDRPIHLAVIEPHDLQTAHRAAHRRAA